MGLFDLFSKKDDSADKEKIFSENQRILAEMQNLVSKMTKNLPDQTNQNNDEAWLERLRKEGSNR